ncbi:MAG: hypothetical protein GX350_03840 [Erysipelotrichaceae bacterium]|nr:hypothetical protein [Erysipelotrichaceae bacterium]
MKDKLVKYGRTAKYYRLRKAIIFGAFLLMITGGSAIYASVSAQIRAAEALEEELKDETQTSNEEEVMAVNLLTL